MIDNQIITVIMPAYNAEKTLMRTFNEIPHDVVDHIILVDDFSSDRTVKVAQKLGIEMIIHARNKGYGANQKTCYQKALEKNTDIVIMLHPDYQYSPKLIVAMASMISRANYDVVLASRMLGKGALKAGMPLYKYISNRILTFIQNMICNQNLSEYHTGFRAWKRKVLEDLPLSENSDDYIFDNEMLLQCIFRGYEIAEISCPTAYFKDASSISFLRSIQYGVGVLKTSIEFFLVKFKFISSQKFTFKK
jgi:glycosyltransferase involved in cell wall biosynthesis